MLMGNMTKTQNFFRIIEIGGLSLFNIIPEAFMIHGYSQMGKTATCHYLSNSTIKSMKKLGDLQYQTCDKSKFGKCEIGFGDESKTEVPNIFQGEITLSNNSKTKIILIDQPGFGDSFGFHRILSNGYFHHLSFSRIQSIKFILVIDILHLKGIAKRFLETIISFFNFFKNFEKIKLEIFKATSFIITKVDDFLTIKDLQQIFDNYKNKLSQNLKEPQKQWFTSFIDYLIKNNKIKLIYKPKSDNQQTIENTMLKQINQSSIFWKRPLSSSKKNVEMVEINFSVANEVINHLGSSGNQIFNEDFKEFISEYIKKQKSIIFQESFSIKNLIKKIELDSKIFKTATQSLNISQQMENMNMKYYNFDRKMEMIRQQRWSTIFLIKTKYLQNEIIQKRKRLYFRYKLQVLEKIKALAVSIIQQQIFQNKSIILLQKMQSLFIQIGQQLSQLIIIQEGDIKQLQKYIYVLYRSFQELKIINFMLFNTEQQLKRFNEIKPNQIQKVLFHRLIKDELLALFQEIQNARSKKNIVQNFDPSTLIGYLDQQIIEWLQSVPNLSFKAKNKITNSILSQYQNMIKPNKSTPSQKQAWTFRLLNLRQFYLDNSQKKTIQKLFTNKDFIKKSTDEVQWGTKSKQSIMCKMPYQSQVRSRQQFLGPEGYQSDQFAFKITILLAKFYQSKKCYKEVRALYRSINDYNNVLKMYGEQASQVNKIDLRTFYIDFGIDAAHCLRNQLALQCFQMAYSLSDTSAQFRESARWILSLMVEGKLGANVEAYLNANPYLKRFFDDEYTKKLDQTMKLNLVKNSKNILKFSRTKIGDYD